jgi:D-arabinose 1-dehydrogenase-like Zn-dependent alcohol dehydrogenase
MKAMVSRAAREPLQLEERPTPTPGKGEVLLRVRACGVCHGDWMVQQGHFPFARYPVVPGHEIAGVVEELGDGVDWLRKGARVGLSALGSSCGSCEACLDGDEFLCSTLAFTGVMGDGGYQELMVANASYVVPLPEALGFLDAAPLMCAGLTVFSALRHAAFRPGYRVAVIGLGGLGHMAVLFARAMGGRVAVVSTSAAKEKDAMELGAELFIHSETRSPAKALQGWQGGANLILATANSVESANAAFAGLAPNGTLVVLGVGPGNVSLDPMTLIMGRRRVMGSPAGSRKDLDDTLRFAARHGVRPRVTPFPLALAGEALAAMHEARFAGRAVLLLD